MAIFDASEIFQFAVRIEENGAKAYRYFADMSNDTKDIFNFLADEEVNHKDTFHGMLSKIANYEPAESYPGEYYDYIKAYVNGIIFSDEELEEALTDVKTVAAALDFGIKRELESILFYQEMKNFVDSSQHEHIEKIIQEERKHFLKLKSLKKDLKN